MDQVHVGEDLFLHIVVAVSGDGGGGARAVLGVDGVGAAVEQGLAGLEAVAVVVADDIVELGLRHVAGHGVEVEEALIAVSLFRYLVRGEHGVEDHGHGGGVDHHILGAAGVDAYAAEGDIAGGGVEVFILDLAQRAAVHGVAVVAGQLRHVQTIHAAADLLVGGEYHADLAVGAALQQLHGSHDLGDAGLVVGAQQGGAIGDDQLLAGVGGQARAQGLRQGDGVGQGQVAALIPDDAGLHILTGGVGGCVHVGDESQHRCGDARRGGQGGDDVAGAVHVGTGKTQTLQLRQQDAAQILLPLRGGGCAGVLVRGGVIGDIAQEAGTCGLHGDSSLWEMISATSVAHPAEGCNGESVFAQKRQISVKGLAGKRGTV